MASLRTKFTLSMLAVSLASALVVGAVARVIVMQRFGDIAFEQTFERFYADVVDYFEIYGSWEEGQRAEPFPQFVRRRNAAQGIPGRPGGPGAGRGRPGGPPVGLQPQGAPPDAPGPGGPPPGGAPPPRPPGAPPRPFGGPNAQVAGPFVFLLVDAGGRVLVAADGHETGEVVDEAVLADGRPVVVGDRVVAVAVPTGDPNLTVFDTGYLDATRDAMAWGIGAAAVFALAVGFFFSDRLSRNVRKLSDAIEQMSRGELRQEVAIGSGDEIGALAGAFNRMSRDLSASADRVRSQADQLRELSIRDELTGLHNRRHFDEQAETLYAQARRYRQPLTVMIGDIDHFKRINDTFSHATGDLVLRRVAELLQAGRRASDVVARYGGEEFVVIFPQSGVADITARCEAIRASVEASDWGAVADGLQVTVSIGVDGDVERGSIAEMLAAADARLYQAKARGRNRVVAS